MPRALHCDTDLAPTLLLKTVPGSISLPIKAQLPMKPPHNLALTSPLCPLIPSSTLAPPCGSLFPNTGPLHMLFSAWNTLPWDLHGLLSVLLQVFALIAP